MSREQSAHFVISLPYYRICLKHLLGWLRQTSPVSDSEREQPLTKARKQDMHTMLDLTHQMHQYLSHRKRCQRLSSSTWHLTCRCFYSLWVKFVLWCSFLFFWLTGALENFDIKLTETNFQTCHKKKSLQFYLKPFRLLQHQDTDLLLHCF